MTESQAKHYRCVLGNVMSFPNLVNYLQPISSRKLGVWIGHCNGDHLHEEHLFVLKKGQRWHILNNTTDIFKKPDGKILGTRMFPRMSQLRCPVGKVYMNFQKKLTGDLKMQNVDIYKCKGNRKGSGHKEHFVKLHHGQLEVQINKKIMRVLIVTIE